MNTNLIIILTLLYLIPISIGILIVHQLLQSFGREKIAQIVRKYLFILLGIGFITVIIVDWSDSHHSSEFKLNDQYEIALKMHELDSFLDAPIDFEITILDQAENKEIELAFQSDGPYFQFLTNNEGEIWINGYGRSIGWNWVIDVKNGEISKSQPEHPSSYTIKALIKSNFEIEKK